MQARNAEQVVAAEAASEFRMVLPVLRAAPAESNVRLLLGYSDTILDHACDPENWPLPFLLLQPRA